MAISGNPASLTFQGQSLVDASGGLLQLCILAGVELRGLRGQQVGVGVGLDGAQRGAVGVAVALLHRQEGPAGFGARHFDAPLLAGVSAVGWRRPHRLLGGVDVVRQLVGGARLPAGGLRLLPLQLLLLPPNVIQKKVAVGPHSGPAPSSPCPIPVRKPLVEFCPSIGQLLGAADPPSGGGGGSPWAWLAFLGRADALQEPLGAAAMASYASLQLACRAWVRGSGGGRGVLGARREGRRVQGGRRRQRGRELVGAVGLERLWMLVPAITAE